MSEPMDDVRANTTPGTDPRVEEMTRPPMGHGTADEREAEGGRMQDRPMEGRSMEGRSIEGERMPGEAYGDQRRDATIDSGQTAGSADDPVAHYRSRFSDAQSRFIDDPKSALEEARSVVEEAIDKYMDSLRMDAAGAGSGDTEQMRRAMQRYRDLFDRLAGGSRA